MVLNEFTHGVYTLLIMSVMRMEIKLQPQFISSICFHFTQKSKQAFYSGLALKSLPKKTLLQVGFFGFLNFSFFEIFKSILYQLY